MTGVVGWILVVLGVISIVLGLVAGAKDIFRKSNEGMAQDSLPTEFLKVFGKLLDAPPAKYFTGFGFLLVLVGLILNGVTVFGS